VLTACPAFFLHGTGGGGGIAADKLKNLGLSLASFVKVIVKGNCALLMKKKSVMSVCEKAVAVVVATLPASQGDSIHNVYLYVPFGWSRTKCGRTKTGGGTSW
jgi:hypothetical protein